MREVDPPRAFDGSEFEPLRLRVLRDDLEPTLRVPVALGVARGDFRRAADPQERARVRRARPRAPL